MRRVRRRRAMGYWGTSVGRTVVLAVLAAACGEPRSRVQPRVGWSHVVPTLPVQRSPERVTLATVPTDMPSTPPPQVSSEPQLTTEWPTFSSLDALPNLSAADALNDCSTPLVVAASAPKSAAKNDDWFWPWVVQTLIAYDYLFKRVANLNESNSPRGVALQEQTTSRGQLSLVARCRTAETCSYLARVLRTSIPGSQATLSCRLPGTATSRTYSAHPKTAEIPDLRPAYDATMAGAGCARLAACARQQDDRTNVTDFLSCQSHPQRFRTRCAARTTCFDVAQCLGRKASSLDLDPSEDFRQQMTERDERIADGRTTVNLNGEQQGFAQTSEMSDLRLAADGPRSREHWAIALLDVRVGSPGTTGFERGSYDYSVAVVDGKGHVWLGPPSRVEIEMYGFTLAGGFQDSATSFDYDGDGRGELLLPYFGGSHSGEISRAIKVWRFDGREVLPYPGTVNLSIVGYEESKGSKRLDLRLKESKWAESLPDGTFKIRESN